MQVPGPFEPCSQPCRPTLEQVCELGVVGQTRPVLGPGAPQGRIQAQPIADRHPRAHPPVEQVADPGQGEAAVPELGDHVESLEVLLAVDEDPASTIGVGEHAGGLVEADGPRRYKLDRAASSAST